ncbi:hypothetical protein [Hyphomicrobium sp. 2TAF46]|uniref:hypothetical protein n=1 Tax=Hyphomicrobium sp. 2TAF46 TaxID=3233019 RepID=UPI003F90C393
MKYVIASALAALTLSAAATLAVAEDQSPADPTRHRMGDEGKLPPTGAVTGRVPEMGAGTGQSTGTEGTSQHRMGDEGKLPATNSMSKKVPEMTPPNTENPGK